MREAPWQEIAVAANATDPLAQQARIRLQTALDGMAAAAAGQ
jgi:hypothetical protein